MRLFIGTPLPEHIQQPILKIQDRYRAVDRVRWIPKENLHLTTLFIGDINAEHLHVVIRRIKTKAHAPFQLRFDQFCFAPRSADPHMIWARFQKHKAFSKLVLGLQTSLSEFVKQDKKKSIPHITIARMKNFRNTGQIPIQNHKLEKAHFDLKELILWESTLDPDGAIYSQLERFEL